MSLDRFHRYVLQPEKSLTTYLYQLGKLLDQAMSNMDDTVRETLLHQFVAALTIPISQQFRAAVDTRKLKSFVDRARLLMTIEEQRSKTEAVCDKKVGTNETKELQKQVETLSTLS